LNQDTQVFVRAARDRVSRGLTPLDERLVTAFDQNTPGFRAEYDATVAPFPFLKSEEN